MTILKAETHAMLAFLERRAKKGNPMALGLYFRVRYAQNPDAEAEKVEEGLSDFFYGMLSDSSVRWLEHERPRVLAP